MARVVHHPVFGSYNPDSICECGHPRSYHHHMGLSENLIVGTNCMACQCREFKESTRCNQNEIIKLRKEIESRKKVIQAQLTAVEDELSQLQERCKHPNKHSQPEYDFVDYWCNDCGKSW